MSQVACLEVCSQTQDSLSVGFPGCLAERYCKRRGPKELSREARHPYPYPAPTYTPLSHPTTLC